MTGLLELREKIKMIYSRYEVFILPIVKFLLAFIVLNTMNSQLGYMTRLDNVAIVLIVSLMCSFLPVGSIVLFAAIFSLAHMYALSMEVALVGLCMYLLMMLLFFRFSPKESLVVVLTPLLFLFKIPYVMPVAMGLLGTPASAVSVGCGVIVYYLINTVMTSAPTLNTMGAEEAAAKIRLLIDGILGNKAMLITVVAFAITVIVVYLVRRMSIDYSWTVAIVAGALTDMLILLVGDLLYDTNLSVAGTILGVLVAVIGGKVIEFFRLCLDYSRTEKVQFEDDEYYYYVKAVPKMSVSTPTKTVKKINTQRKSDAASGRGTVSQGRQSVSAGGQGRTAGAQGRQPVSYGRTPQTQGRTDAASNRTRTVTTERTPVGRTSGQYGQSAYHPRPEQRTGGRSVTIGGNNVASDDDSIDYEDIF